MESKQKIIKRRQEIERKLAAKLKAIGSSFSLRDAQDVIYNAKDNHDLMKVITMFDRGGDVSELESMVELVSDAWNYLPHKALGGLSPAEKMFNYEQDGNKKQTTPTKGKKLTAKQRDLLWGENVPYSEANLIKEVRILDDSVSRIFIVVDVNINPTTFEIIKAERDSDELKNDRLVQELIDHADYLGPQDGYRAMSFREEFINDSVMIRAENVLECVGETLIKIHKFVTDNYKI